MLRRAASSLSFAVHRPSPPLPSFPTRRSSDLAAAAAAKVLRTLPPESIAKFLTRYAKRIEARKAELVEIAQDRKSTRLNSSHRCISYAVFCLKKKKMPLQLHATQDWMPRHIHR